MTSPGMSLWSPEAASKRPPTMPNETRHQPGISIVLTSSGETAHLRRCLESFSACWSAAHAEVIVVRAGTCIDLALLAQQFTNIVWIATESRASQSDLRRIGLERGNRDVVLFLDDRDSERHQWAAAICRNWLAWTNTGGRVMNAPTCCGESEQAAPFPYVSVVMPVHDGGPRFLLALQALALSDLPRQSWELVIVDDASNDETAIVAAQYADKLLRLRQGPRGPGYARNRGFELTLGECVAFVNADVMVATDTLRNAVTVLTEHPDIGAVFGSCDAAPMMPGFLSEYRSLVQRYYHHKNADDSLTFSSACGVVRSSVFENAGGYDEWHFSRRQLEDLELGQRIRALGERIVPHSGVRATHLRQWTLRRMIATEIFDRAVPWMRLVKRQLTKDHVGAHRAGTAKKVNIVLCWFAAICAAFAWSRHSLPLSIAAVACVAVVLVNNAAQLAFFARRRGIGFAAASVPLDMIYYLIAGVGVLFGWIVRQAVGDPTPGAVAEAFAEMGTKRWPPVPVKRVARSAIASERPPVTPQLGLSDFPLISQDSLGKGSHDDSSQPIQ